MFIIYCKEPWNPEYRTSSQPTLVGVLMLGVYKWHHLISWVVELPYPNQGTTFILLHVPIFETKSLAYFFVPVVFFGNFCDMLVGFWSSRFLPLKLCCLCSRGRTMEMKQSSYIIYIDTTMHFCNIAHLVYVVINVDYLQDLCSLPNVSCFLMFFIYYYTSYYYSDTWVLTFLKQLLWSLF